MRFFLVSFCLAIVFAHASNAQTSQGEAVVVTYGQFMQSNPNYVGAPGPKGFIGPPGERGEQGVIGDRGSKGDLGPIGDKGPQGPIGPPGPFSDTSGTRGPPGDRGEPGDSSPQPGPPGENGEQGAQGPPGVQGEIGEAGPNGERGPKGERGDPGSAGLPGEDGSVGAQGAKGAKGEAGAPGKSAADPWAFDYDKYPPYYCSQSNPSCERVKFQDSEWKCPNGLTYDPERKRCSDLDECSDKEKPVCLPNQLCVNTPGSYNCYNASLVDLNKKPLAAAQASLIYDDDDRRSKAIPALIGWLAVLTILLIILLILEATCHSKGSEKNQQGESDFGTYDGKNQGAYVTGAGGGRFSEMPTEQFFLNTAHVFPDLHSVDSLNETQEEEENSFDSSPQTQQQMTSFGSR